MNLEERVVAAEVASRRADGPGVIEVQSQLEENFRQMPRHGRG